jgi:hypothetical protein
MKQATPVLQQSLSAGTRQCVCGGWTRFIDCQYCGTTDPAYATWQHPDAEAHSEPWPTPEPSLPEASTPQGPSAPAFDPPGTGGFGTALDGADFANLEATAARGSADLLEPSSELSGVREAGDESPPQPGTPEQPAEANTNPVEPHLPEDPAPVQTAVPTPRRAASLRGHLRRPRPVAVALVALVIAGIAGYVSFGGSGSSTGDRPSSSARAAQAAGTSRQVNGANLLRLRAPTGAVATGPVRPTVEPPTAATPEDLTGRPPTGITRVAHYAITVGGQQITAAALQFDTRQQATAFAAGPGTPGDTWMVRASRGGVTDWVQAPSKLYAATASRGLTAFSLRGSGPGVISLLNSYAASLITP